MSPEKQRIAVAKAIGWTNIKIIPLPASNKKHSGEAGVSVCGARHPSWGFGSCSVPDYLNDLNAMHAAEQVLTYEQKEQFVFWMNHIHPSADIHHSLAHRDFRLEVFSLVHSPASQRCEAFLRTLGLWEEEQE